MKKIRLLILLTFFSCDNTTENSKVIIDSMTYEVNLINIDSCQYLMAKTNYGVGIIHKQNCKNHK